MHSDGRPSARQETTGISASSWARGPGDALCAKMDDTLDRVRLEITTMTSTKSKDDILEMLLVDLAGICKKLADNSAVPDQLCTRARQLIREFDTLVTYYGNSTPGQRAQGEELLFKITRFLPSVLYG